MKKTNKIFVLTLLLTVAAFVARADGFKPSGTTTSGGITNGDLRAVTLTNAANVFAGSFSGNLNGEFGAGINPYLFTNGLAVDCVNSDGLGGDNIFTVSANLENIYDGGLGLSSGENFFWTNSSSLTYQIYSNSVASPVWSTWQVIYPAITETPLGSSGKSRYGFNATASVNAFYYVQRTSGAPSFSGAISGGAKGKTFSLGFDTNGGFSDLNLNFSGVPILKLEGASGVLDLNDSTGNNIASGSTKFGFAFGNGAGGTSASVDTNGIFYGKNFVGSGAGLTNLTSATVQTNASIVRTNDTTWFDAKGAATAATNVLGANAYTSGTASNYTALTSLAIVSTNAHLFGQTTNNVVPALGQFSFSSASLNTNVIQLQNYEVTNANAFYYWSSATNAYTNATVGWTIAKATNAIGNAFWWCLVSNIVWTNSASLNTNQAIALGLSTNSAATNNGNIGLAVGLWQRGYVPQTLNTNGTQNPPVMAYAYTNGNFLNLTYSGDGTNQVPILLAGSNNLSVAVPQFNAAPLQVNAGIWTNIISTNGNFGLSNGVAVFYHTPTTNRFGNIYMTNANVLVNSNGLGFTDTRFAFTWVTGSGWKFEDTSTFASPIITFYGNGVRQGGFGQLDATHPGFYEANANVFVFANNNNNMAPMACSTNYIAGNGAYTQNFDDGTGAYLINRGKSSFCDRIQITNGVATYQNKTPVAVTVGASPFNFTNMTGANIECYFSGGTAYSVSKNQSAVYSSLAGNSYFVLQPTNFCTITYTVAPTLFTNQW